jgi:hypothetical protein
VNQEIPAEEVDENDPLQNKFICTGCQSGCDRCDPLDISVCLRCGEKLYLYEGACSGDCPEGWRGRNRECYNESDDLRVLWFPFLITAFILTIVVFFGRLKTKAVLKNGVTNYISN